MDFKHRFEKIAEVVRRELRSDGTFLLTDFTAENWRNVVLDFLRDAGMPKTDFSSEAYIQEKTLGDILWNLETYLRVQPCVLGDGGCLFMTVSANAASNILQAASAVLCELQRLESGRLVAQ